MQKLILFSVVMLLAVHSEASTVTANSNGSWESAASWSGSSPACGDSIVIPANKTITVTSIVDFSLCTTPMQLTVYGSVIFQTGKKLKFPCGSRIYIYSGGSISPGGGGGSSNLIDICGVTVWTASQGSLVGTDCLPPDPTFTSFVLPVEFSSFSAYNSGKKVAVEWTTSAEKDNDFFTIERSPDGTEFKAIGITDGQGTSHEVMYYRFYDDEPLTGNSYYRIRQTDYNGHYAFSPTVAVSRKDDLAFGIYPNPSKGSFLVSSTGLFDNKDLEIILQDASGRNIPATINKVNDHSATIDLGNNVKGIYILYIKGNLLAVNERIIVQ
jgi:hypothetical protein